MVKLSTQISRLLCGGVLMAVANLGAAQSAASYPSKPVRAIVPSAPGGATTAVATMFAERLGREMGQNFIVDHRPGGDSIIGTVAAARATPDGYTLLVPTSSILVINAVRPDLHILRDLTPISTLTRSESVLAVYPGVPVKDLKEFISYAKARPGQLNVASSAPGSTVHYQGLMNATGIKLTIINYKGAGPAVTDVLTGDVHGIINNVANVTAFIKAGKLKGLAIGGEKRSPVVPDVPTFAEAGLKGFDPGNWLALFVHSKTPKDIIEKLNLQVRKAEESAAVISTLDKLGLSPNPMTLAQAQSFMRTEGERFGKLIKDSGLKAEDF